MATMRTFLFMAVLLVSSAASAQVTFLFGTSNTDTLRFGKGDCGGRTVTVNWTRTLTPCVDLSLWLTTKSTCTGTAADTTVGDVALTSVTLANFRLATTGSFTFNITSLPFGAGSDAGAACGSVDNEQTFYVCGATKQIEGIYGTCGSTVVNATAAKVVYDGLPPTAPTISSVAGLDGAVVVTLDVPSDATTEEIVVSRATDGGDPEEVRRVSRSVGSGALQVDGLENGVTYLVQATVSDDAGNVSAGSDVVEVTPVKTYGYLELYANAGGRETGGCGAVGGGVAGGAVLAALGFWLFSRRNRSWLEQ